MNSSLNQDEMSKEIKTVTQTKFKMQNKTSKCAQLHQKKQQLFFPLNEEKSQQQKLFSNSS